MISQFLEMFLVRNIGLKVKRLNLDHLYENMTNPNLIQPLLHHMLMFIFKSPNLRTHTEVQSNEMRL